jgi:glycosyltransferase involved in cell wall biosynthesis
MKVLHILHELKYSGAEIMYVDAAPLFQEKGCELTVMATANELGEYAINFEKAGFSVLHMHMPILKKYLKRIAYYKKVIAVLKSGKFEVVHIHSSIAMWGFAMCAWLTKTKSVYTFHNVFPTHFYTYPYHVLLRWSAKYLFNCSFQTISDSVYNHEAKLYHNSTTKIYNWYGSNRYFPAVSEEKNNVRVELGIDSNTLVVISVGGCSSVKRHSDIIQALPLVLEKIPNAIYLHLGKGEAEEEEKKLAINLRIEDKVWFCNNQRDVRKYLIASDIYLMPSRFEGISITTIEAMACAIPSILYDVPGLRDFNKNGENSLLIPEDFKFLAENIVYLYENPIKASIIAESARNFVNQTFSIEKNVAKIFELYNAYQ